PSSRIRVPPRSATTRESRVYATSVRPLPLGANRLCAFCCSVGCIVTSIGSVRPAAPCRSWLQPLPASLESKGRSGDRDVVASPRKECTHKDLWIGCGETVRGRGGECHRPSATPGAQSPPGGHYSGREMPSFFIFF